MTTNVTPVVLQAAGSLTTSAAVYITGAANSQTIIKRVVFNNITGGALTITVYRVPAGGSALPGNQIISTRSIAANSTDLAPELAGMVLDAGDTIQALASAAASIAMFASGYVAS